MPWPVPPPGVISARAASLFEQMIAGIDARSDNTVATVLTRITELAAQDLYFFQGYLAQQLFVDTATDWLPLHGAMWGVPQDQATVAAGNLVIAGLVGAVVAQGVSFGAASGAIYQTLAAVTIGADGTASVEVSASVVGTAGNLPAGTVLNVVSPVAGIAPQTGTVDANGITGGLAIESDASWRARIQAKIQTEPSGGNYGDYVAWIGQALPGAIGVCPAGACGGGVVNVAFVMPGANSANQNGANGAGPTAPTADEIAVVAAYIAGQAPVTAQENVNVFGASLVPVDISLQVRPNTVAIQAAAQQALALFFAQSIGIGATLYMSQLDAAIAGADGEQYHERLAPAADVAAGGYFNLLTLGSVTFS